MRRRLAALLLGLALLLGGCGGGESETPLPTEAPPTATLPPEPEHPALPTVRLYFDGLLRGRGYVFADTVYLPPALLCEYYGLELWDESAGDELRLELPGVSLRGEKDDPVLEAEGRWLYCPGGWFYDGERLCLPAAVIEKLFGLTVTVSADRSRAEIGSTGYALLQGGENYYARHFDANDLYWLSHIIYAEAHLEPLAGQIGVGNVVLNRVADERFPSTIVTVALDEKQFDPVSSREVLYPTDETAMIAACLCLEGFNTVEDALYYVNPKLGEDGWFRRELRPVVSIGSHDFYA